MKNILLILTCAVAVIGAGFILQSFIDRPDRGNSVSIENIGEFKSLSVNGCMDVMFTQGATSAARLEGDKELGDQIEFIKENDALTVKFRDNDTNCRNKKITVYLSSPALQDISLAGSGNVSTTNQLGGSEKIHLSIAGSGNMSVELISQSLATQN